MFAFFFLVWLILNGRVTPEICVLGVFICAALFFFICRFMEYSLKKEWMLFSLLPLFIRYFWVLVEEIVKANVCVLKIITSPRKQPEPALVYFDTEFRTGTAKVMLANSITLTPERLPLRWRATDFVFTVSTGNLQRAWRIPCL